MATHETPVHMRNQDVHRVGLPATSRRKINTRNRMTRHTIMAMVTATGRVAHPSMARLAASTYLGLIFAGSHTLPHSPEQLGIFTRTIDDLPSLISTSLTRKLNSGCRRCRCSCTTGRSRCGRSHRFRVLSFTACAGRAAGGPGVR